MTVLTRELEIDLAPEVVWDTLLDVGAWPRWMVGVNEAGWTDVEGASAEEGSRLWFRHHHNERAPLVFAEVSALRPTKELAYRPVGGDLPFTEGVDDIEWQWRLFRRPGGGTRLRFTLTYEARGGMPFFQELLGTRVQVLNHADSWLQALRSMSEGTSPVGGAAEA